MHAATTHRYCCFPRGRSSTSKHRSALAEQSMQGGVHRASGVPREDMGAGDRSPRQQRLDSDLPHGPHTAARPVPPHVVEPLTGRNTETLHA